MLLSEHSLLVGVLANWGTKEWTVFAAPFAVLVLLAIIWMFLRNTIRTRLRLAKQLRKDPDINEWIVVFNWSRKVLYVPTIVVSFVAALVVFFDPPAPTGQIIGGIWLAVFFLNFLVDEYELSIKLILIVLLCAGLAYLWLMLLGWDHRIGRFFASMAFEIDWKGYLLFGVIFSMAVVISWIRGLFYYVAITSNYLNIQEGPTESGQQIGREDYTTRIDTGDFLERILGFGRLVISFRDNRTPPMILLVRRIGRVSRRLESIRGKLAIDREQPPREGSEEWI
jgi:hypothetical protein